MDQHFLLISLCFQKASFTKLLKVGIVWQRVNKRQNLEMFKLKPRTDDNPSTAQMMKFVFEERTKQGENAGNQRVEKNVGLHKETSGSV